MTKRCRKCGQTKSLSEYGPAASSRDGTKPYCRPCDAENSRNWARRHPEVGRAKKHRQRIVARKQVFGHYGTACACCGSTEKLTIDHVNGDGAAHRLELFGSPKGGSTLDFHRWLIREGFPDGFQVLCGPYNTSKGRGARCKRHSEGEESTCYVNWRLPTVVADWVRIEAERRSVTIGTVLSEVIHAAMTADASG